jgi:predicted acylesterase/phospholipase RssA
VRKSDGSAIKFRTYAVPDDCKNGFESCKIWEAARATSAAPFYFPAVTVNQVKFWDGGLANNNPAHEVKLEKYMLFPSDRYRVSCFVSIGTGWADTKPEKSVLPGIGRGRQILGFVTNVDRAHQHMAQDFTRSRPPVYFRFNPTTGNEKIGLADHHLLKSLEAHTNRYLQNPQVQSAITDCAKVLCERREKKRLKVVALEKRS